MSDYILLTKRDQTQKTKAIRKECVYHVDRIGAHSDVYFVRSHASNTIKFDAEESFEEVIEALENKN